MKDALGTRMKDQYEYRTRIKLMRRCPTIIRIDGKAFHTYTNTLNKPFDDGFIQDMQDTTKFLVENIQGCKAGYVQSDEISLLLTDYDTIETQAWFDNNLQKLCSISASMTTSEFNRLRTKRYILEQFQLTASKQIIACDGFSYEEIDKIRTANFDSRVFQIADVEEVINYFIWRFKDCIRNSVQGLAQSVFSHKQLMNKSTQVLIEMLENTENNWNDLSNTKKFGTFFINIKGGIFGPINILSNEGVRTTILPLLQRKD